MKEKLFKQEGSPIAPTSAMGEGIGARRQRSQRQRFPVAEFRFRYKVPKQEVIIKSSEDAEMIFRALWDKEMMKVQEQMYVLFLDSKNMLISWKLLHTGTGHNSLVDVRLLLGYAFACMASSIIIAHNHPSGTLQPSKADIELMERIRIAADIMDMLLVDSLILSPTGCYSFIDRGHFERCTNLQQGASIGSKPNIPQQARTRN
jgi:DNA repair protein RadC